MLLSFQSKIEAWTLATRLKKKETYSLGRSRKHDHQILMCHKFPHISPFSENIQFPGKSKIQYLYLF